jgi:hypothetical protein
MKTITRHCIKDGCGLKFEYKEPTPYEPTKLRPFFMWYCDKHKWVDDTSLIVTNQMTDYVKLGEAKHGIS